MKYLKKNAFFLIFIFNLKNTFKIFYKIFFAEHISYVKDILYIIWILHLSSDFYLFKIVNIIITNINLYYCLFILLSYIYFIVLLSYRFFAIWSYLIVSNRYPIVHISNYISHFYLEFILFNYFFFFVLYTF